ncbi:putative pectine lyase F Short=PLF [Rhizoctonia solani AG-1 IB]|uniref:Putative pectine lyase F Short=PLF n=1 Tax=Thanatephorus cucumeris (strain AG1-IB / isolate 7/3/14) TaxID=1108050 RepID=M5CFW1_THACB|nr:putative pectine lyase F Short=PLF [Rhizoctonia solani AG-1 IB]
MAALSNWNQRRIKRHTTGGAAAAAAATPTLTTQLASWLLDGTACTIVLNRTYNFTDSQVGNFAKLVSTKTYKPLGLYYCNRVQALDLLSQYPARDQCQQLVTITYRNAGTSGLPVGSNKTILGKGTSGWIKGKGLQLVGSKNVIIQNIHILNINHQFVWGGNAIDLKGANNI